jgi:hypothetical protein
MPKKDMARALVHDAEGGYMVEVEHETVEGVRPDIIIQGGKYYVWRERAGQYREGVAVEAHLAKLNDAAVYEPPEPEQQAVPPVNSEPRITGTAQRPTSESVREVPQGGPVLGTPKDAGEAPKADPALKTEPRK